MGGLIRITSLGALAVSRAMSGHGIIVGRDHTISDMPIIPRFDDISEVLTHDEFIRIRF